MFKKILSALLAVMMLVSVLSVAVVTSGAAEVPVASIGDLDEDTLYFDSSTTGWEFGAKSKVAFYIFGGDFNEANPSTVPMGRQEGCLVLLFRHGAAYFRSIPLLRPVYSQ